jgi:hypothetical protein
MGFFNGDDLTSLILGRPALSPFDLFDLISGGSRDPIVIVGGEDEPPPPPPPPVPPPPDMPPDKEDAMLDAWMKADSFGSFNRADRASLAIETDWGL